MDRETRGEIMTWVRSKWKLLQSEAPRGNVSQGKVEEFVKHRCATIHRLCRGTEWSGSDAVWAALAKLQTQGEVPMDLQRKHKGGAVMVEWQKQSLQKAGWTACATRVDTAIRFEVSVEIVMHAFLNGRDSCSLPLTIKHLELSSVLRRLNNRFRGTDGVNMFHTIIAWCATQGKLVGDIARKKTGGARNEEWGVPAVQHLYESGLIPGCVKSAVIDFLGKRKHEIENTTARVQQAPKGTLWVLDLCCGSKSRSVPVTTYMRREHGKPVMYIGVDICPNWWDGKQFIVPELVGDLADDNLFPPGNTVSSIATTLGLNMANLLHVFMSTPCQTNSKADASNRNKMCGYRDWRHPNCRPLPVGVGLGFTTQWHNEMAEAHDRLEQKIIIGVMHEAADLRFSFSAENPVGAMARKEHMAIFHKRENLKVSTVNYCAFGGHYLKATHLFHNMPAFTPKGLSGDGRCAGKGSKKRQQCPMGTIVDGHFRHQYTIGRESTKEFKSEEVSRKRGKNELPAMLTAEMMEQAYEDWKCSEIQGRPMKRRKTSTSLP